MVGQSYRERPPAPELAGLVSSTWVQRVLPGSPSYLHRNIPNGSVELVCRVGEVPRIAGPLTAPRSEELEAGSTVVGLRFHPGAAAAVLGLPAAELADLVVGADEVWGSVAVAAGEQLAVEHSDEQAVGVLQTLVETRLAEADRPDPLIAEAVRRLMPWRGGDVGAVGSELSVSERSFRRHCQAAIGVGPKTLQRMLRFQGFLAQTQFAVAKGRKPAGDGLARLAVDAGYADQAHLTRECVRLTGVTPKVFLRDTEENCGCGHDHEVSYAPMVRTRAG